MKLSWIESYVYSKAFLSSLFLCFLFAVMSLLFVPITLAADDFEISDWEQQPSFPYPISSNDAFVFNRRIYVIGGGTSTVFSSSISEDGSLSNWQAISNLPLALYWHTTQIKNNRVYVLGGAVSSGGTNSVNQVLTATINEDGSLSSWQHLNPLPERLSLGKSFIYQNKLYQVGGGTETNSGGPQPKRSVYYSEIYTDGTLGPWISTTSLPDNRMSFTMFNTNNKVIIVGGTTSTYYGATRDILVGEVAANGDIISWTQYSNFPLGNQRAASTTIDNLHILLGGYNGINYDDKIYFANSNDLLDWKVSQNKLPTPNCCFPLVSFNNHLYVVAGHNGTNLSTVYSTKINTQSTEIGPFELPVEYQQRLVQSSTFKQGFWDRLSAGFDHILQGGIYRPYTGDWYKHADCPNGFIGITCYDGHNGTDFSRIGDGNVYSVTNGVIAFTSEHTLSDCTPNRGGFGCVVIIEHPSINLYTLYAHLSQINLNQGSNVTESTLIGKMGKTGCPTCGIHLHFGVLKENISAFAGLSLKMSNNEWEELLYSVNPGSTPRYKPFCSYNAPNGKSFTFIDPSGWRLEEQDPWSLDRRNGGCGATSPYLWKYDIGTQP